MFLSMKQSFVPNQQMFSRHMIVKKLYRLLIEGKLGRGSKYT